MIITGASSGLGRALACYYAQKGHLVGAIARRKDLLESLQETFPKHIFPIVADVTHASEIEHAIHRFAVEQGSLDLVYANAGVGQHTPEEGWDPDSARRIAEINVVGSTNTIAPAISIMREQGHGRVIGISSLAGCIPLPASAAYGASKAWMVFYLQSLAQDLDGSGVKCTVVMPGYIPTALADGATSGGSGKSPENVMTPGAERAAALIAHRVAAGASMIQFPRKIAWLTRIGALLPVSIRTRMQRNRLSKRQSKRQP